MPKPITNPLPEELINLLTGALHQVLLTGGLPRNCPVEVRENQKVKNFINDLDAIQKFLMAMANGDLEPELKVKGKVAGALKTLQSNLRQLTWQAQRIASGDLNQSVAFMGDFATAINAMVENLSQTRATLEQRAAEAQEAHKEAQSANRRLRKQLREIRALQAQLREEAIRDPLTGCFNRRYLEETLDREFSRALRENYPVSLAMIDIDQFKNVNDRFGHQAGDLMLQAVGNLFRSETRAGDIICRYGGEEFLLVLPNTPLEATQRRAESWRSLFEDLRVLFGDGVLCATLSCGLAAFPKHGGTRDAILEAADQALYAAKDAGRNCVRVYSLD